MTGEVPKLSLLAQREIEARIVGPLVRAFAAELGRERTLAIVRGVVSELARDGGAVLAHTLGEQTLEAFAQVLGRWRENDALEIQVLEQSPDKLDFNVVRCRYAEMYRELGMADLGSSLSCQRDFALAEGFSSEIRLARSQTLMDGAPYCDFRFRRVPESASSRETDEGDREHPRDDAQGPPRS